MRGHFQGKQVCRRLPPRELPRPQSHLVGGKPQGRWRVFPYAELIARDKANLDIFWLRYESLEDSDNLPDPDVLAREIMEDLKAALREIEALFDAAPGTPGGDRLEVLVALVAAYEEKHYPVPLPDPIEAIQFHMQRLGLTRKDLEPLIGTRARVSEVLNRKRPLTLQMIRRLSAGLGIAPEILIQEYPLNTAGEGAEEIPVHLLFHKKENQPAD